MSRNGTRARAGSSARERQHASLDPRDVFLRGQHVLLKALSEADVDGSGWYGWLNDETVTQHMQQHYYPQTREDQVEYWRQAIKGARSRLQLGVCAVARPGKLLGCVSLANIDPINRKAEIATLMGEPEGRNVRFYLEANQLLIRHAFEALNLRRIYGGTVVKEVAEMMCRVLGFRLEGVWRQDVYKRGTYHDVYFIGLLRDEFRFAGRSAPDVR